MTVDIQVPDFPESITEGTIGSWIKSVGDHVDEGETIVEIETDKVVLEIPAPASGILEKIIKAENELVGSQEMIGQLSVQKQSASQDKADEIPASDSSDQTRDSKVTDNNVSSERTDTPDYKKTSPATRKHMQEKGVMLDDIDPSGKNKRVTKNDIDRVSNKSNTKAPSTSSASSDVERVQMSSLRKSISDRLVNAQQEYAMLTTFNEVNMQRIIQTRSNNKDKFQQKHGVKLSFMSFFVLAAVEALKAYPIMNASVEGKDILYHQFIDIGVAVSTERGLVVPVVRGADEKSLLSVELEINRLADEARENKLDINDLTGGTFTITNGGVFGSMLSTPIVNPPQSAILGMHAIEKRPVVIDDEIRIAPMMYLALSYDHRIIDGREAVLFLSHIKKIIEDPIQLLLSI